jgi:hypothetical protein
LTAANGNKSMNDAFRGEVEDGFVTVMVNETAGYELSAVLPGTIFE